MKRLRALVLWTAVCAVLALAALTPESGAGMLREEALRSRWGGWAGVLRLWAFEGWQSGNGSLSAWLNDRIGAFEKSHSGVYIQLTEVSAGALRGFASGAANPPDMILFPPGLLEGADHLLALTDDYALRAGLEACGMAGEGRFALPVAMGAYGLAFNCAALDALPADWRALPERPAARDCAYWLDWPADSAHLRWSAAMNDLLAGEAEGEEARREAPVGEGLDLGLPTAADRANAPLPQRLPDDFGRSASVFSRFANGEIAAMPVTQREIRRLQLLSDTGRGPDWAVAVRSSAYTDQIALLAVTDCGKSASESRQALGLDFAALLLSADSQAKLTRSRAFPVIDLPALYAGSEGMAQLEVGLAGRTIRPEAAFGTE